MPLEELLDESGVEMAGAELAVFQNLAEETEVGADAANVVLAQGSRRAVHAASLASSVSYSMGTVLPS